MCNACEKRCLRCGLIGHCATNCIKNGRELFCSTCGELGHIKRNCYKHMCSICHGNHYTKHHRNIQCPTCGLRSHPGHLCYISRFHDNNYQHQTIRPIGIIQPPFFDPRRNAPIGIIHPTFFGPGPIGIIHQRIEPIAMCVHGGCQQYDSSIPQQIIQPMRQPPNAHPFAVMCGIPPAVFFR